MAEPTENFAEQPDEPDLAAELEAFVAGEALTDAVPDDDAHPIIGSEAQAQRSMRALRWLDGEERRIATAAQAEVDSIMEFVNARIGPIREWAETKTTTIRKRRAWIERSLEGWARLSKRKTWTWPAGTLTLRAPSERIEIVDEALFVAWAQEQNQLSMLKATPVKTPIKAATVKGVEAFWADKTEVAHTLRLPGDDKDIPGVLVVVPNADLFKANPAR